MMPGYELGASRRVAVAWWVRLQAGSMEGIAYLSQTFEIFSQIRCENTDEGRIAAYHK